jgi:hypothetical protein
MAVKNRVKAITLTSKASSTVTGSYAAINASGLTQACFLIRINNASNQAITISYDGTNDHDYLAANTALTFDFQANSQPNNFMALLALGTIVYVKGTAGTGTISLSGYYLEQSS